jgi:hypothetical protein
MLHFSDILALQDVPRRHTMVRESMSANYLIMPIAFIITSLMLQHEITTFARHLS